MRRLLIFATFIVALAARGDDAPSFYIQGIRVEGTRAERIVIGESGLHTGRAYGEPELRDAAARIQRLPFIVSTDFRLEKGSSPGNYILVIAVRSLKPWFVNAQKQTEWLGTNQVSADELDLGARWFVGAKGALTGTVQRRQFTHDRYALTYTQYDLFDTRASITAVASYLQDPGVRRSGDPLARTDWHHRDNILWTVIGVLPIGDNDSLRGTWEHEERPIIHFAPHFILQSLPQIRRDLFYIHDTTDDPLFPTSGTRITAGGARTFVPSSGFTIVGRQKQEELKATLERSWALTPVHAATVGGSGDDFDQRIRTYRAFGRWSMNLWSPEKTLHYGDLRFELEGDRVFMHVKPSFSQQNSTVRASVAYRSVWGLLRLELDYTGWSQVKR